MLRLAALAALAVSACTAGEISGPGGPSDAPGGGTGDGGVDARVLMWVDAAPGSGNNLPCKNLVSPAPDLGHHNPGRSCFQQCHNHGFTLAGTLYTNATGNTAFSGATMSFIDANNQMFDLVTNLNGNFYTNRAIAFPVLVIASACPSAVRMNGSSPNGNCNANGCHVGGTNSQMHLP